jgi:hypothetical protein
VSAAFAAAVALDGEAERRRCGPSASDRVSETSRSEIATAKQFQDLIALTL